jgi:hypothetical protein
MTSKGYAFWNLVIAHDGKAASQRSAERYRRAITLGLHA